MSGLVEALRRRLHGVGLEFWPGLAQLCSSHICYFFAQISLNEFEVLAAELMQKCTVSCWSHFAVLFAVCGFGGHGTSEQTAASRLGLQL